MKTAKTSKGNTGTITAFLSLLSAGTELTSKSFTSVKGIRMSACSLWNSSSRNSRGLYER